MKIDPYNHKERYLKWKNNLEEGITGISKENSEIIINYIFDMENGINISSTSAKGRRSYIRLKKEFVQLFNQLKEKRKKFGYQMTYYKEAKDLEKRIKEMKKNGEPLPILISLRQEE